MTITHIISGFQTGADIAAIHAAVDFKIREGQSKNEGLIVSGFAPKGKYDENGPLADLSPYVTVLGPKSPGYPARTKLNIEWSNWTVDLYQGSFGRGTELTIELLQARNKPRHVFDLLKTPADDIIARLADPLSGIEGIVNWAGSRESSSLGIHDKAYAIVSRVLDLKGAR